MSEIGIGSTVWVLGEFAASHTVAQHRPITGQTDRSWVFKDGDFHWSSEIKFPKRADKNGERWTAEQHNGRWQVFFTDEEMKAAFMVREEKTQTDHWIRINASRIADQIIWCKDAALLRQIAALVGYKEETKS